MSEIKNQFNEYLQEQSMISMEKLLGEDQKQVITPRNKQEGASGGGKKGRNTKRDKNEKFNKKEMAYVPKGQKAEKDAKWQPKGSKSEEKLPTDEEMNGTPSYAFIRKIYNLMSFKQEQLNEILLTEQKIQEKYGGDIKLAKSQTESGAWSFISKTQFEQLNEKKSIQQSIEQYNTIFNIYKGFHHKNEKSEKFNSQDLESLAVLMTLAQNSQQLILYLQYQQALKAQNGQSSEVQEGYPQIADVWKITKFYNSMTFFGVYSTSQLDQNENIQPTKNMNMAEKVEHVKSELKEFLINQNKNSIENSIYCQDKTQKVTFSEIQEVVRKFQNNTQIYKEMQITPNYGLNQQLYPMQQMMFPFQQQMAAAQMQMSQAAQQMQMYQPQVAGGVGAAAPTGSALHQAETTLPPPQTNVEVPIQTQQEQASISNLSQKVQETQKTTELKVEQKKPRTKFDWNEVEEDDDNNDASPIKQEKETVAIQEAPLKTEVPQYIPHYGTPSADATNEQQIQQPQLAENQNNRMESNFYQGNESNNFVEPTMPIEHSQDQQQWQQYSENVIESIPQTGPADNNWVQHGRYENRNYGGINVRRGGNRGSRGYNNNRGGGYADSERTSYYNQEGNSRGGYQPRGGNNYRGYRGNRGNRGGGYQNYRNKYDQNQDNQNDDNNNQQLNSNSQEFNQEDQGNFKVFQRNRGGGGGYQKYDNYGANRGDDQQQQYYSRSRGSYANQYQNSNYQNFDGGANPFYRNTSQSFNNEYQGNFEENQTQFTHYSNNNQDNQKQT